MNHSTSDVRKALRKQLRTKRRSLSPSQQQQASQQLLKQLRTHPVFLRSKHIALYMADDGEIDLQLVMQAVQKMGKQCYLPILHPLKHNTLWFGRYTQRDSLLANRFGLAEPSMDKKILPSWALDLVLMPLVGFDRQGNRLGMGGGFYDRTFSFKPPACKPKRPVLMGVAHKCQEVPELTSESWDVRVNFIVTDQEIITIK